MAAASALRLSTELSLAISSGSPLTNPTNYTLS
jgi:hypothetical protein